MSARRAYRSVRPDLRRCSLDVAHLPVQLLTGGTPTDQAQKGAFHTSARRYLRAVAGALAAAGYTQARIATNNGGVLVGGETRLCSRRPDDVVRLVVVIAAGSTLCTIPGIGRLGELLSAEADSFSGNLVH